MKSELTQELVQTVVTTMNRFPEIGFCTLFGSAAHGRLTASSDVDIAVAALETLSLHEKLKLSTALSEALHREVDLVDLNSISGLILEQALCHSIIVSNNNHDLYAGLLKRLWYNQADMMPYVKRILEERVTQWLL